MSILKNKDNNIFNCQKTPEGHDPIKFIFTKTNENIKKIIEENKPASIIRIGGSDYDSFWNNKLGAMIYELNGYFDKTSDSFDEEKNYQIIRDKYIESIKNSNMITVGNGSQILKFGFVPNQFREFEEKEKNFLEEYIPDNIPICHFDFVNLDYENNFFLNIFPILNNKKICIISSFTEDIKEQLLIKDKLFENKCYNNRVGYVYKDFKYPEFKNVEYINVPICYIEYRNRQKLNTNFNNSIEFLESIEKQIDNTDSEIYLIGAGVYTCMLCDYVKKKGKVSIYCGSSIQLFFGLKGNRYTYLEEQNIVNEHWKYPDLSKCTLYSTNLNDVGGFETDGLMAYTHKYK
jgi:hypothetical protein